MRQGSLVKRKMTKMTTTTTKMLMMMGINGGCRGFPTQMIFLFIFQALLRKDVRKSRKKAKEKKQIKNDSETKFES